MKRVRDRVRPPGPWPWHHSVRGGGLCHSACHSLGQRDIMSTSTAGYFNGLRLLLKRRGRDPE